MRPRSRNFGMKRKWRGCNIKVAAPFYFKNSNNYIIRQIE